MTAAAAAPAATKLPRIIPLVLVLALFAGVNAYWPELLPMIVVLLALYLATTYSGRVAELAGMAPATLSGWFSAGGTAAGGAGGSQARKPT